MKKDKKNKKNNLTLFVSYSLFLLLLFCSTAIKAETSFPKLVASEKSLSILDAIKGDDLEKINALLAEVSLNSDVALFSDYLMGKQLLLQLESIDKSEKISDAMIAAIDHFMLQESNHPLTNILYKKTLRALIGRQQWSAFMQIYNQDGTDYEECAKRRYWLTVQKDLDKALAGFDHFWSKGYRIPQICDPIFSAWKAAGGATQDDFQRKFVNAINHGQVGVAKSVLPFIDEPASSKLKRWVDISIKPSLLIDQYQQWSYPEDDDLLLYGLRLLINKDSVRHKVVFDEAYAFREMPDKEAWWSLRSQLILYLLSRNDSTAVNRFFALPKKLWRDAHRDWYVRTLMRAGQQAGIKQFLQQQPKSYHFPSDQITSKSALNINLQNNKINYKYNKSIYNKILNNKNIIKSLLLKKAGLMSYAVHEWRLGFKAFSRDEAVQMVYVAQSHDWPHRMIRVSADMGLWDFKEALYPKPYELVFEKSADDFSVDESLAYAIAREESHFNEFAKSSANAIGIMQLTPSSAKVIAGKLGIHFEDKNLYNKNINIKLGIKYLSILLKRFEYKEKAIAAYNAGPTIAATWNPQIEDMDVWVSLIPYKETRLYVQRVLAAEKIYQELYGF